MSYEGRSVYICEQGHLNETDCYEDPETCFFCKGKLTFLFGVDQTNGMVNGKYPGSENYAFLKRIALERSKKCDCCGHVKVLEPERFEWTKRK